MTLLWIVRHGEAEPRAVSDADRALTPRGWAQARAAGHWIGGRRPGPQRIFCSPYRRARETAAELSERLGLPVDEQPLLTPDASLTSLLAWLEEQGAGSLLVSHQPLVSALAGMLLHGSAASGPPLGTASVVELQTSLFAPGWAHLRAIHHAAGVRAE